MNFHGLIIFQFFVLLFIGCAPVPNMESAWLQDTEDEIRNKMNTEKESILSPGSVGNYETCAESGNDSCQYFLGRWHHLNAIRKTETQSHKVLKQDNENNTICESAISWYKKSAGQNNPNATYRLSQLLRWYECKEMNDSLGEVLLAKSGELGSIYALLELGLRYEKGIKVEIDHSKAYGYLVRAKQILAEETSVTIRRPLHEISDSIDDIFSSEARSGTIDTVAETKAELLRKNNAINDANSSINKDNASNYLIGENNFVTLAESAGAPTSFSNFKFGMSKESAIKILNLNKSFQPHSDPDEDGFYKSYVHSKYFPIFSDNKKQVIKLILKFTKSDHLFEIEVRFKNNSATNYDAASMMIQKSMNFEFCEKFDYGDYCESCELQVQHWGNIKLNMGKIGNTNHSLVGKVSLVKAKLRLEKGTIQEGLFPTSFSNGLVLKFTGLNLFCGQNVQLSEPDFSSTVNCYGADSD